MKMVKPVRETEGKKPEEFFGDEFVDFSDILGVDRDAAKRSLAQALAEIRELESGNRWEDIIAVFYPVEEKAPELQEQGLDLKLRARLAFALGQVRKFDEAIRELLICTERSGEDFYLHSSLAYTAYNSLYSAKNREIFLSGKARRERIDLAHKHFDRANEIRPDGVTCFYRKGMLLKEIEAKPDKAIPFFQKAVGNWESLGPEEKDARHQERKNYIKALYQLASALLSRGRAGRALFWIKKCLEKDEKSNHLDLIFKYFALGKVYFHLNSFAESRDALLFAARCGGNRPMDYVFELLARTYLSMKNPEKALEAVNKVAEKRRRPYFRWTEADVLSALGRFNDARRVLNMAAERDGRSRHKALVRLARLEYGLGRFKEAERAAVEADAFFQEKWMNRCFDALYIMAAARFRLDDLAGAAEAARELQARFADYPKARLMLEKIEMRREPG